MIPLDLGKLKICGLSVQALNMSFNSLPSMKTRDGPESLESGNSRKVISLTAERQRLFVRVTAAGGENI
jgi:hypothetical protein